MSDELSATINELAMKLGAATEDLWPALVKHQFVTSLTSAIILLIAAVASIVGAYLVGKKAMALDDAADAFMVWVGCAALGFMGLMFLGGLFDSIPGLIYPESAAIRSILG